MLNKVGNVICECVASSKSTNKYAVLDSCHKTTVIQFYRELSDERLDTSTEENKSKLSSELISGITRMCPTLMAAIDNHMDSIEGIKKFKGGFVSQRKEDNTYEIIMLERETGNKVVFISSHPVDEAGLKKYLRYEVHIDYRTELNERTKKEIKVANQISYFGMVPDKDPQKKQ